MVDWPAGARALFESARVAHLATADRAGVPHLVPICFVLERDRLYTIVDQKPKRRPASLKRLRNISENPEVAVLVDEWDEDWSKLAWVRVQGTAAIISDEGEYSAAVQSLRGKYAQYRDVRFARAAHPLIRIEIARVVAWKAA